MTKIEWTQRPGTKGETWNPIRATNKQTGGTGHFCVKVSAGCQNCYAADFQKRFNNKVRYAAQDADKVELFLDEIALLKPLHWKKPRTIFVCSMTDLFYEGHDDEWINRVWAVMALCPQHTFIILTKRPERMSKFLNKDDRDEAIGYRGYEIAEEHGGDTLRMPALIHRGHPPRGSWPLPNVWLGVSVEDQAAANQRIPVLLDTPAAVRFLSVEPLLGPVNIEPWIGEAICASTYQAAGESFDRCDMTGNPCDGISWVIVGGESGHNARPMHPDWARSLRDQCKAAGVPFFFKQWGAFAPGYSDDKGFVAHSERYLPDGTDMFDRLDPKKAYETTAKVGKKRAGRSLDGVEHNEWPEVKSC